jgi:hypothetical protein
MEDWHLGKTEATKPGIDTPERTNEAQLALETFAPQSATPQAALQTHVRRRGSVTHKFYLEATSAELLRQPGYEHERHLAAVFSSATLSLMKEAAQKIPLKALTSAEGEGLLRALAPAFQVNPLDWLPFQLVMSEGPAWLKVNSTSGACALDPRAIPPPAGSPSQKLLLRLTNFGAKHDQMECSVDLALPANGGPILEGITKRLAQSVAELGAQELRTNVSSHLSEVYDFGQSVSKGVAMGRWAQVVSRIALLGRTAALSHIREYGS